MLCDAGPLVAVIDARQPDHERCDAILRACRQPPITTWSCLTEAMYLLGRGGRVRLQQKLGELMLAEMVAVHPHGPGELADMMTLMRRYQNVPMDLADASLVAAAEVTGERTVFTLDSDFRIYRLADGSALEILP